MSKRICSGNNVIYGKITIKAEQIASRYYGDIWEVTVTKLNGERIGWCTVSSRKKAMELYDSYISIYLGGVQND